MKNYAIFTDKALGKGSYGEVFMAEKLDSGETCVAKKMVFKDTDDKKKILSRLQLEVNILKQLRGSEDILKIWDTVKDDTGAYYIITEYVNSPSFIRTFRNATPDSAQYYLYHLLKAIDYTHSRGIVHRDIKGDNCLFDPNAKTFRLIDFGLSDFFLKDIPTTKFPGSLVYKAPELFLEYAKFDYAVDMWAFGCVMGSIVFHSFPHFFLPEIDKVPGEKDHDRRVRHAKLQMHEIVKLLGTDDFAVYCYKYRDSLRQKTRQRFSPQELLKKGCPKERVPLTTKRNTRNKEFATDEAIDLLERIFVYDHELRMTAREALKHPYFRRLRRHDDRPVPSPPGSLSSTSAPRSIMITTDSNIIESDDEAAQSARQSLSASCSNRSVGAGSLSISSESTVSTRSSRSSQPLPKSKWTKSRSVTKSVTEGDQ